MSTYKEDKVHQHANIQMSQFKERQRAEVKFDIHEASEQWYDAEENMQKLHNW